MSPEQAGGSTGLDGRSDLYSLVCLLYKMLAGAATAVSVGALQPCLGGPARIAGALR